MKVVVLLMFWSILSVTWSARILFVSVIPSISHQFVFRAITKELINRGHELVIITPNPLNQKHDNVTEIDMHDTMYGAAASMMTETLLEIKLTSRLDTISQMGGYISYISEIFLSAPPVKSLIQDTNQQFDLVIVENLAPPLYGFAHIFRTPYIGISSFLSEIRVLNAVGNPTHPLLYTHPYSGALQNMNIWQKIQAIKDYIRMKYYSIINEKCFDQIIKKHFGEGVPTVADLESNVDLILTNTHPVLTGIRPLVPSVVTLQGFFHIQPRKPLPQDLEAYLDNSSHGVVYFSLGTNVQSKDLPPELMAAVLGALRRLPQRVLWKFEDDNLPELPSNVRIEKWLPQQDLLGHPNVKAFITQGGQQSMEEAISNGVPMVAIPLLADQDLNAQRMEHLGIAVCLEIWDLTEDNFYAAIEKVLNDERYQKNVAIVRDIVLDEPMKPLDRAVWWIEYVLRHKGAQHLRAPAAAMPLWEYFMLDVIGVLATALVLTLSFLFCIIKFLRRPTKKKIKTK